MYLCGKSGTKWHKKWHKTLATISWLCFSGIMPKPTTSLNVPDSASITTPNALPIQNPCVAAALMALVNSPLSPVRVVVSPSGCVVEFKQGYRLMRALEDIESGEALLDWHRFRILRSMLFHGVAAGPALPASAGSSPSASS